MVTTGGVLGTLCPPGGTMMGPMGPRLGVLAGELWLVAGEETGDDSLLIEEPLGSSACLASLRRAAAKLEDGAAWTDKVLLAAGLPLGTMEPLRGEGVRGLTVAVVRVAVESIPKEGDFDSWLMPSGRPVHRGPRSSMDPLPVCVCVYVCAEPRDRKSVV